MATTASLIQRANFIHQRYAKYTKDEENAEKRKDMEAFEEMVYDFEIEIKSLLLKAEAAKKMKSRSEVAAANAQIRKGKKELEEKFPQLEKLAKKKGQKTKKLTPEIKEKRAADVERIQRGIDAIPDGREGGNRKRKDSLQDLAKRAPVEIKFDPNSLDMNPAYNMEHSEESSAFAAEWQVAKKRQDTQLDEISKGVKTLKQIADDMGTELEKQSPQLDAVEDGIQNRTQELREQNKKLKKMLLQMRSPQKLCVDLLLVAIMLGIGAYIVQMVKPQAMASAKTYVTETASNISNSVNDALKNTPVVGRRLAEEGRAGAPGGRRDGGHWEYYLQYPQLDLQPPQQLLPAPAYARPLR